MIFASDFCCMHYRGFGIIHDDIRCAGGETIVERATRRYLNGCSTRRQKEEAMAPKLERYGTDPKGMAFFDTGGRDIIDCDAIRSRQIRKQKPMAGQS